MNTDAQHVFAEAMKLPESQRLELIDALLTGAGGHDKLYADAPPLSAERRKQLAQEGLDCADAGHCLDFDSPETLSKHVGGIFRQAGSGPKEP